MTRRENDIKAPDGYLLGGVRRVRPDGTILFQRGYWELPDDVKSRFVGEDVWCHEVEIGSRPSSSGFSPGKGALEVAHPGLHIYEARSIKMTVIAERNDKPDAKPGVRSQWRKDWINRSPTPRDPTFEACRVCSGETNAEEAACLHCGTTKAWANDAITTKGSSDAQ
jgi:hypothetical protein